MLRMVACAIWTAWKRIGSIDNDYHECYDNDNSYREFGNGYTPENRWGVTG